MMPRPWKHLLGIQARCYESHLATRAQTIFYARRSGAATIAATTTATANATRTHPIGAGSVGVSYSAPFCLFDYYIIKRHTHDVELNAHLLLEQIKLVTTTKQIDVTFTSVSDYFFPSFYWSFNRNCASDLTNGASLIVLLRLSSSVVTEEEEERDGERERGVPPQKSVCLSLTQILWWPSTSAW